jgi:hypothetical protein
LATELVLKTSELNGLKRSIRLPSAMNMGMAYSEYMEKLERTQRNNEKRLTTCNIIEKPMTSMKRKECILPFGHKGPHKYK